MSVRAMGVVGEARWLLEQVLYRALYYGYSGAAYDLTLTHSENIHCFSFEVTTHSTIKFFYKKSLYVKLSWMKAISHRAPVYIILGIFPLVQLVSVGHVCTPT